MRECSKAVFRRLADARYSTRYLVGSGVDIGGKPDPLTLYMELFPGISATKVWDLDDGDAQFMEGVAPGTYDFVHSSHCLEHLHDPRQGLASWLRILKPGGHLVLTVPEEDMYEQGVWPSTFNRDHKHTFTIHKPSSWSPASLNVFDLLAGLGPEADVRKVEVIDQSYRFDLPRYDQTLTPITEAAIEIVVRKRLPEELERRGRLPRAAQPSDDVRVYYNQYKRDQSALRDVSRSEGLFANFEDI